MNSWELDKRNTKNMIRVVVIYFCFLITVAVIAANLIGKRDDDTKTITTTTTVPLPIIEHNVQTYIPC